MKKEISIQVDVKDLEKGNNPLTVSIEGTLLYEDTTGSYTCYEVKIIQNSREYRVFRRYSEFAELYSKLIEKYPELQKQTSFPPASWFFKFSPSVISERKVGLQKFLQYLVNNEKYCDDPLVVNFIK